MMLRTTMWPPLWTILTGWVVAAVLLAWGFARWHLIQRKLDEQDAERQTRAKELERKDGTRLLD
jgi:hypothetical protein